VLEAGLASVAEAKRGDRGVARGPGGPPHLKREKMRKTKAFGYVEEDKEGRRLSQAEARAIRTTPPPIVVYAGRYTKYEALVLYFAAAAVYHKGTPEIFPLWGPSLC
jgi:hypothetical protein